MDARTYLQSIVFDRDQVDRFLTRAAPGKPQPNHGWIYDPELGWVHDDAMHPKDGVDGAATFYHYEPDGARKLLHGLDQPCRVHAYGDSFTHGDQVSDGEVWCDYLAAHLQEPIRNYGVGGYSVYQAYRRMKKIHREGRHIASHVILNIYEDDHFRSLASCWTLRFAGKAPCGFTCPHLRVNVKRNQCLECENLIQRPEDVYKLCDADAVYEMFKNDPLLTFVLAARGEGDIQKRSLDALPDVFGLDRLPAPQDIPHALAYLRQAGFFATQHILRWVEQFCDQTNKKLLVMLSVGPAKMLSALRGEPQFDQAFTDWLKTRPYPVLDMRDAFKTAFADSKLDAESFLRPYYIGHHTPAGNFFTAWAVKDAVVDWLQPKPIPYRAT